jgi:hypothetical protein
MTPANWLRSSALAHLARRPRWSPAELEATRELARQVLAVGNKVNQIAHALNIVIRSASITAAKEAAELVDAALRRLAAVMTSNFDRRPAGRRAASSGTRCA